MTRDLKDDAEPPTTQLSAQELRAFLAEARNGAADSVPSAEVDTSVATRLFVPVRRPALEPPTRRVSEATRLHALLESARAPAAELAGPVEPGDGTRTCFAAPAFLPRPRLGGADGARASADEPLPADSRTERLTVFELPARELRAGHAQARSSRGWARLRSPLLARLRQASTLAGRRSRVVVPLIAGLTLSVTLAAQLLPALSAPTSSGRNTAAPLRQAALVSAPSSVVAPASTPAPAPPAKVDPEAPPPSLRRAVDLLLAGHTRDALDAYRALAHVPGASPALLEVARLLEHEARECAQQRGATCP